MKHPIEQRALPLSVQAESLIRDYAFGSSLTGFIPVPFLDTLGLIGVQRLMLLKLSRLYGVPFSKHLVTIALTTLASVMTTKVATPLVGSLLKMIPGIGTLLGGVSMAALGGASTYAVGKVFQKHFSTGGTIEDFDPEQKIDELQKAFERGKEISQKHRELK